MPIVFIHGVNNRDGVVYRNGVALMRRFFEEIFAKVTINGVPLIPVMMPGEASFPYWGGLGATFAWNMASMPRVAAKKTLGAVLSDDALQPIVATWADAAPQTVGAVQPLLALARERGLRSALFALTEAMLEQESPDSAQVSAFLVAAAHYAEATPKPAWLWEVPSDSAFVDRLLRETTVTGRGKTLGAVSGVADVAQRAARHLRKGVEAVASHVKNRGGDFLSTKLLASTRPKLNATLGRFFGDIFVYFSSRGTKDDHGPIPLCVEAALDAAVAAGGPLVVVAHSLGGVIAFDVLSHFRTDIEVDLFVTIGSQVAHFEEMKLYRSSDPATSAQAGKASVPRNIRRWVNVYDPVDIFAYLAGPVFDRVTDVEYDTHTHTVNSHGAYFDQLELYQLLVKHS